MLCGPKVRKNYYASSSVSLSFPQRGLPGVDGTRGNRKGAGVKGGISSTETTLGSEDRNPPPPASGLRAPAARSCGQGSPPRLPNVKSRSVPWAPPSGHI